MKNFFGQYAIVVGNTSTEDQYEDILYSFIHRKNLKKYDLCNLIEEIKILPENVKILDYCLSQPIEVSEEILNKYKRIAACAIVDELGYQHIHRHKMLDIDSLSEATINSMFSSVDSDCDDEPKEKKTRSCAK